MKGSTSSSAAGRRAAHPHWTRKDSYYPGVPGSRRDQNSMNYYGKEEYSDELQMATKLVFHGQEEVN